MNDEQVTEKQGAERQQDAALLPLVDVIEDERGITLSADLPGVPKDKLDIQIDSDKLTIEGDVTLPIPDGMEASHVEVGLSRYRRAFTLSRELDAEKIAAEFSNGVLTLRIPKTAHAQPRKINVQAA